MSENYNVTHTEMILVVTYPITLNYSLVQIVELQIVEGADLG